MNDRFQPLTPLRTIHGGFANLPVSPPGSGDAGEARGLLAAQAVLRSSAQKLRSSGCRWWSRLTFKFHGPKKFIPNYWVSGIFSALPSLPRASANARQEGSLRLRDAQFSPGSGNILGAG